MYARKPDQRVFLFPNFIVYYIYYLFCKINVVNFSKFIIDRYSFRLYAIITFMWKLFPHAS